MPRIMSVVGARPNFIKIAPILRALAASGGVSVRLVHTGQHYDASMNDVFFRERPELDAADGPVGAQGVPLTAGRSLAVDRRYIPLGAPLWLETTAPWPEGDGPLRRLMVAQDSGGAIKGPVRGDVFWGNGEGAEAIAGRMRSQGRYMVLLPKAAIPTS